MATSRMPSSSLAQRQPGVQPGAFGRSLAKISALPSLGKTSALLDAKLRFMRIDVLRKAIRDGIVSFPSQIPTFSKHSRPDLQMKLVQLYFVAGWSRQQIRVKYGLGRVRTQQIICTWKNRAIELGYIQSIPPDQTRVLTSLHSPIRVVITGAPAPPATSAISATPPKTNEEIVIKTSDGQKAAASYRPRRRHDWNQIAAFIQDIRAGRSVAQIASELGVHVSAIYSWKKEYEMRQLLRENEDLKDRLSRLRTT